MAFKWLSDAINSIGKVITTVVGVIAAVAAAIALWFAACKGCEDKPEIPGFPAVLCASVGATGSLVDDGLPCTFEFPLSDANKAFNSIGEEVEIGPEYYIVIDYVGVSYSYECEMPIGSYIQDPSSPAKNKIYKTIWPTTCTPPTFDEFILGSTAASFINDNSCGTFSWPNDLINYASTNFNWTYCPVSDGDILPFDYADGIVNGLEGRRDAILNGIWKYVIEDRKHVCTKLTGPGGAPELCKRIDPKTGVETYSWECESPTVCSGGYCNDITQPQILIRFHYNADGSKSVGSLTTECSATIEPSSDIRYYGYTNYPCQPIEVCGHTSHGTTSVSHNYEIHCESEVTDPDMLPVCFISICEEVEGDSLFCYVDISNYAKGETIVFCFREGWEPMAGWSPSEDPKITQCCPATFDINYPTSEPRTDYTTLTYTKD